MNNTMKQIVSGVAVVVIAALLMGSYTAYTDVSKNTEYRESNIIEKKIDTLIDMQTKFSESLATTNKHQAEIRTNQAWIMQEYKANK